MLICKDAEPSGLYSISRFLIKHGLCAVPLLQEKLGEGQTEFMGNFQLLCDHSIFLTEPEPAIFCLTDGLPLYRTSPAPAISTSKLLLAYISALPLNNS